MLSIDNFYISQSLLSVPDKHFTTEPFSKLRGIREVAYYPLLTNASTNLPTSRGNKDGNYLVKSQLSATICMFRDEVKSFEIDILSSR